MDPDAGSLHGLNSEPGPAGETAARVVSPAQPGSPSPHGDPLREAADDPQRGGEPGERGAPTRPAPPVPAGEPEAPVGPGPEVPSTPERPEAPATVPGAPADPEGQVGHGLQELTAQAQKADEYLELAQRTRADFENYRRRAAREAAAAQERGVSKLAKELLPAVDNLDRALQAAEVHAGESPSEASESLISGLKLVHTDLVAALSRAGIEGYSPQGERFDPQHHEAVAQQPVPGAESGTIVEVFQPGYRIGESVLRPARVVVAQ